jgi:methyl-accepting chemotaxis protein
MSAALIEELDRLRAAMTGIADGFKSDFLGASTELNTTISGFDKLLGGVDATVKASSDAMKQAVERLSAHEEVVKHLDDGAARLKEAAVELTSMRDTFTLSAQRNSEAASAQERAATVNEDVANKLQLVGDKLPEVQASLTDGAKMIASLGQPLMDLKDLLGRTPEVFGGQLNTTLYGFETVIKGVDDTVRSSRDAMNQAVERLTAHEDVVIQLKEGSIRLQEAANELSSMRDTFTLSAQKNSDAAAAQEKAATANEGVANKFQMVGDKLPQVQEAISDGARIIASLGQPLLALKDVLDTTPQIFGQQAEIQADRDERRSTLLLEQTEKLAATVAAAAEKFARVETLSTNLGTSSENLERAGTSLAGLATAIEKASVQHANAAKSSEKAALAGERAADKLTPLPESLSGVSSTLNQAGGQIKIGAEAARDVYREMLAHQKQWFEGIEVGLRGMKDQVQMILDAYGDMPCPGFDFMTIKIQKRSQLGRSREVDQPALRFGMCGRLQNDAGRNTPGTRRENVVRRLVRIRGEPEHPADERQQRVAQAFHQSRVLARIQTAVGDAEHEQVNFCIGAGDPREMRGKQARRIGLGIEQNDLFDPLTTGFEAVRNETQHPLGILIVLAGQPSNLANGKWPSQLLGSGSGEGCSRGHHCQT